MRTLLCDCLDLLLPRACAGCGRAAPAGAPLCAGCAARLPWLPDGACSRCGAAHPSGDGEARGCPLLPDALSAIAAPVAFEGDAADCVRRFKYAPPGLRGLDPRAPAIAAWLCALAVERLPGARPTCLVPVPDHPRRLRQRGFHPAGVLAGWVGRDLGLHVDRNALVRCRATPSQTGLGRAARARNVAGAFAATRPLPSRARICLVDDVVTTGATLVEAARALRHAGAGSVVAVCAARTPVPE